MFILRGGVDMVVESGSFYEEWLQVVSQRAASIMNATFAIDFVVSELSSLKQRIRTCRALSHARFWLGARDGPNTDC